MATTAKRLATYEELLLLQEPEHLVAEIIDGRLVPHPRPAPRHALAASSVGASLCLDSMEGREALAVGGTSKHRVCIWDQIFWFRIWRVGATDAEWGWTNRLR